jgi:hypothetical protein
VALAGQQDTRSGAQADEQDQADDDHDGVHGQAFRSMRCRVPVSSTTTADPTSRVTIAPTSITWTSIVVHRERTPRMFTVYIHRS